MSDVMKTTPFSRANTETVEALCENDKVDVNRMDSEGRFPLFAACKMGDKKYEGVVRALLTRKDLEVNVKCQTGKRHGAQGKTSFHIACELSHAAAVMMLLEVHDLDVTIEDDNGINALAAAKLVQQSNTGGLPAAVYMRMAMMGSDGGGDDADDHHQDHDARFCCF